MNWRQLLSGIKEPLEATFDHLHRHAEVSWEEYQTTSYVRDQLEACGLRVTTYADGPGLTAEWGPAAGPVVALRADMDALWQEVDGEWRANHSCGHDAHMTAVLGAARLLRMALPNPPMAIRTIFQPAEETGEGAIRMVERGALDRVVYLFGLHLRPIQELPTGRFSACIRNGGALQLDVHITGQAAHGARPHLGVNAIEAAFAGLQAVQTIHLNPMIPHSAKMTRIQAGGRNTNIIPDSATCSYDLRAQTNELLDSLVDEVERRIRNACAMLGAEVRFERGVRVMAAQVGCDAQRLLAESIVHHAGETALVSEIVTPGAEDFHYYTALRPDVQATMLGVGCNLSPGLHHPQMTFDRAALFDAACILADAVFRAIQALEDVR